MKWSSSIRKWSRLIHRDLSFFFAGMVLIYAISGIVMNHRDTINPNFSIERKEYKITGKLPGKEGMKKEKVLTLLQPLGEEGNYTKHYFPKADIMKVFLKGGSNLQVNVSTGEAVYESPAGHSSEQWHVCTTTPDNGGLTLRISSQSASSSSPFPESSC